MVMVFKHKIMEKNTVGNLIIHCMRDMDTLSTQTKINMMANGRITLNMERESSRKHQLEELKEEDMKKIK